MMLTIDSVSVLSRNDAEDFGFAVFTGGEHVCVDLTDIGSATISVKTGNGELVTFAFIPRQKGKGHQCVDIKHHGVDGMKTWIAAGGDTLAVVKPEQKATLVILNLPERE